MKSNQKSVRLSDHVNEVVERYRGDNFSDKFANLVEDFLDQRPMLESQIKNLRADVDHERQEIYRLQARYKQLREVHRRFEALVDSEQLLLGK